MLVIRAGHRQSLPGIALEHPEGQIVRFSQAKASFVSELRGGGNSLPLGPALHVGNLSGPSANSTRHST
eukprot:807532-Pyramimonas_sp.AAC.1